jgi:hypothetical protein
MSEICPANPDKAKVAFVAIADAIEVPVTVPVVVVVVANTRDAPKVLKSRVWLTTADVEEVPTTELTETV